MKKDLVLNGVSKFTIAAVAAIVYRSLRETDPHDKLTNAELVARCEDLVDMLCRDGPHMLLEAAMARGDVQAAREIAAKINARKR